MARKTAKKRKVHHRRRRVGGVGKMSDVLMKAGGVVGGVFLAGEIQKMLTSVNPKILGGGFVAVGLLAPKFIGKGSPLIEGIGMGVAAKGANSLLTSFGLITGIGALPYGGFRGQPFLKSAVGANRLGNMGNGNSLSQPIGGVKDLAAVGAMYDN